MGKGDAEDPSVASYEFRELVPGIDDERLLCKDKLSRARVDDPCL